MKSESEHTSWRDLLTRSIDLGMGAIMLTKEAAQKAIDELVAKGEVSRQDGTQLLERLIERGKEQKERLEKLTAEAVDRALDKADLARGSELRQARALIAALQERLDRLEMDIGSARPPHEPPE
jgi:polyhydroxyalkanoate synthesis regulator phasin